MLQERGAQGVLYTSPVQAPCWTDGCGAADIINMGWKEKMKEQTLRQILNTFPGMYKGAGHMHWLLQSIHILLGC